MRVIGVIGGSKISKRFYDIAYCVGACAAKRGAAGVCGGLSGVMEAAAKGARENGGRVIGILPGRSKADANKYVDIPIATGFGEARNIAIVNTADGLIAVDGKEGTLSEIAFALKSGKPIAGIETYDIKGIIKERDPEKAVDTVIKLIEAVK